MGKVLLSILLLTLSGCSLQNIFQRSFEGPHDFNTVNDSMRAQYLGKGDPTTIKPPAALVEYQGLVNDNKLAEAQSKRNEIVAAMMAIDDYDFQKYAASAGAWQRGSAFFGDVTVLGLTAASAISGGEQAKTALSGIAAFITGSRIAFEKDVLFDTALPILLDRMSALRHEQRRHIERRFHLSVTRYPLAVAMLDVYEYYRAGTLNAALNSVVQDTANRRAAVDVDAAAKDFLAQVVGRSVRINATYEVTLSQIEWVPGKPPTIKLTAAPPTNAPARITAVTQQGLELQISTGIRQQPEFAGLAASVQAAVEGAALSVDNLTALRTGTYVQP